MALFVDGSAARQIEETPSMREKMLKEQQEQRRRERARARARAIQEKKAAKRRAAVRTFLGLVGAAAAVGIIVLMLTCIVRNNTLARDISGLEATLAELKAQNDSKQYDIDSSVDMNTIITRAGKLGMVRGTAEQIR